MLRPCRPSLHGPVLAAALLLLACGDGPTAGTGGRVRERWYQAQPGDSRARPGGGRARR